jgi:hypothetical protein
VTPDENVAIATYFLETLWNKKDLSVIDELCTPDSRLLALWANPMLDAPEGGIEATKKAIEAWLGASPDIEFTFVENIADDKNVVSIMTATQWTRGPMFGVPPGKIPGAGEPSWGIAINTFNDEGKITMTRTMFDAWDVFNKMGVVKAAANIIGRDP